MKELEKQLTIARETLKLLTNRRDKNRDLKERIIFTNGVVEGLEIAIYAINKT